MADRIWLHEGPVDAGEAGDYSYNAYIDIEADKPHFTVHSEVHRRITDFEHEELFKSDISFEITDPIEIGVLALYAAKTYGACVVKFTVNTGQRCWLNSTRAQPEMARLQRMRDTAKRMVELKDQFKGETVNALKSCVPFAKLFSGPGGNDTLEGDGPDVDF